MQDFRKLNVWQKGRKLTASIYAATESFPRNEQFRLTSQLRASAASIPTNIAEGCGRDTPADFARFLSMSFGSASEVESHLLIAQDLKYIDAETSTSLLADVSEIKRMVTGLIKRVRGQRGQRPADRLSTEN